MDDLTVVEQATPSVITGAGAVARGTELATELSKIIESQKLYAVIQGRKFVTAEGWGTLGALVGCFPEVTRCVKLERSGEVAYEAEVVIRDTASRIVSRGMAICSNLERSKKGFEEYAIMSMAQTRATGKAFRICFSWIVKLAGYDATPAEEVTPEMIKASAFCLRCKKLKKITTITQQQSEESTAEFGYPLCLSCVEIGRASIKPPEPPKPYNRDLEEDELPVIEVDDDFSADIGEMKPPDFLAPEKVESPIAQAMKAGMEPTYQLTDTFPAPEQPYVEPIQSIPLTVLDSCWKHNCLLKPGKKEGTVYCQTKLPDGTWCKSWKERPPAKMLEA